MANIRDVAERAGVGIGTVSRVLNNSGYVSAEARLKIEQAMAELEFTPNQMARNLGRQSNNLVAIIVPNIGHPFFGDYIKHAEMELYMRGYKTVICDTMQRRDREQEFLDMLRRRAVDGIIMGSHALEDEEYRKAKGPIVSMEQRLGRGIPMICSDHRKGGRLAAQRLAERGCRRVAQFVEKGVEKPADERHLAFAEYLEAKNIEVYEIPTNYNRLDFAIYLQTANKLFNEQPQIEGFFGVDLAACAVLKVAHQRGIPVPEKLKVVGYDGSMVSEIGPQNITTVVQPIREIAQYSVSAVVDLIENRPRLRDETILDVYLHEGDTA
ncbi:MAG: LacI family DNA-binding transcriptional regulator [Treponema sp.]|jgi:LacI family sucrose operon transcriptional repressor|nr:LacI family DNA-binding transcriptional regulator [Treponema sp.]